MNLIRTQLRNLGDAERHTFIAVFERYGKKSSWFAIGNTVLLKDIRLADSDKILTDHVWLTVGKQLYELGELKQGDIIQFNARVGKYYHKFFDRDYMVRPEYSLDFRLDRANKFAVLNREVKARKLVPNNIVTDGQREFIKAIEEKLVIKFTGQTKSEASKFISDHVDEFKTQK